MDTDWCPVCGKGFCSKEARERIINMGKENDALKLKLQVSENDNLIQAGFIGRLSERTFKLREALMRAHEGPQMCFCGEKCALAEKEC